MPILRAPLQFNAQPWAQQAACRDATNPDLWFPRKGGTANPAREVCTGCDVRGVCLQYALDNREPHGVWGGVSERDRRQLLRKAAS